MYSWADVCKASNSYVNELDFNAYMDNAKKRFFAFLERINVDRDCFKDGKNHLCFNEDGKIFAVNVINSQPPDPTVQSIRGGNDLSQYKDDYANMIEQICSNLNWLRASESSCVIYPDEETIRHAFWSSILNLSRDIFMLPYFSYLKPLPDEIIKGIPLIWEYEGLYGTIDDLIEIIPKIASHFKSIEDIYKRELAKLERIKQQAMRKPIIFWKCVICEIFRCRSEEYITAHEIFQELSDEEKEELNSLLPIRTYNDLSSMMEKMNVGNYKRSQDREMLKDAKKINERVEQYETELDHLFNNLRETPFISDTSIIDKFPPRKDLAEIINRVSIKFGMPKAKNLPPNRRRFLAGTRVRKKAHSGRRSL